MASGSLTSLFTLLVGFALAGATASLYQGVTDRRPGFHLIAAADVNRFAVAGLIALGAPFLILRNILVKPIQAAPALRMLVAAMATIVASLWSLASGAIVMTIFHL